MTEEDKKWLAGEIASELEDSAGVFGTGDDLARTALLVVDRIDHALYVQGWMPPATYERVRDWASRTANLPEQHVNRSVLTAHLSELSGILHDR